jgi:hypothetical protein
MNDPGPWVQLAGTPAGECWNEIVEAIVAANLSSIAGNVYIRDTPNLKDITFPAVVVTRISGSYSAADGGLSKADRQLRYMVAIVQSSDRSVNVNTPNMTVWEDTIFRLFAKKRAFTIAAAANAQLEWTDVEEGDPSVLEAWRLTWDASYLGIVCKVRYH